MSYLQNKTGTPKFKEAIISFWFRIPSASMAAIPWDNEADPEPVFNGVLPLLVMGAEGLEEGKYNSNPKATLWHVTDFKSDGPFYYTQRTVIRNECTSYNDFHYLGLDLHCCLINVTETMHTPVLESYAEDYYKEDYRVVYSPKPIEQKSNPTCIGVTDDGYLYVNFQTNEHPKITGDDEPWTYVTSITPGHTIATSGRQTYTTGLQTDTRYYAGGVLGCVGLVVDTTTEGPTYVYGVDPKWDYKQPEEHKESFPNLPYETGKFYSGGYEGFGNSIKVSPNQWHHVLVSVKLKTTKTHNYTRVSNQRPDFGYDGGSLLYVALDDKNYTKNDLSRQWGWGGEEGKFGPNEVFPYQAWDIATDGYWPDRDPPQTQITYELEDPEVPAGFIGIPAIDNYVEYIQQVETAELQIWFGKSFDTGDVKNRRLFIDSKGKPVPPEKAEEKLGKPAVLLHGSNKWKRGMNTGTLAPKSAGTGQTLPWFTPMPDPDGIVRWKPDPSLHGPQNKNEKEPAPQQGEP